MADELLLIYVRQSLQNDVPPSAKNYWKFTSTSVNPNYQYLQQTTFTFLHAMMMLRKGICHNQSVPILAAKSKLALLLFWKKSSQVLNFDGL